MGLEVLLYIFMGGLGGVIIGLLGVGGGIIMIPLLLFLPPAFGMPGLDMKAIAALTVTNTLVGSSWGAFLYFRQGIVSKDLVCYVGTSIFVGALGGGVLSKVISNTLMLQVFGTVAIMGGVLMLLPRAEVESSDGLIDFHRPAAVAVGLGVGVIAGILGVGGGLLLIPLLIGVVHVPTKVAIGNGLPIVFLSTLAGFLGKLSTLQLPFLYAAFLVFGVIPGTKLGTVVNKKVDARVLRGVFAAVVIVSGIKVWWRIAHGFWI